MTVSLLAVVTVDSRSKAKLISICSVKYCRQDFHLVLAITIRVWGKSSEFTPTLININISAFRCRASARGVTGTRLSCFSLHNCFNKCRGMYCPVCGIVHIKDL